MLTVKERRAPGRFGGSPETLDQDQERALKRRILLENDLGAEDAAELVELVRTRRFGLDGLADWLGQRQSVQRAAREAGQPCKFTRVELEIALAERQLATVMSPRSALAYASWMVAAERGWNPANLETSGVTNEAALASPTMKGALGPTFQYLQPRGEPAPLEAKAETGAEPAARPSRLAEGSGLHALPVLFINPLRRLGSESEATQPVPATAPLATAAPTARLAAKPKANKATAHLDRDELLDAVMTLVRQDGGGEPLPADALAAARAQLGSSAAAVRVHTSERAGEAATLLGAAAFTIGRHIYFAPGEFAPGTEAGDRLLRHELTHVQQYERGELAAQGKAELTSETSAAEAEAQAAEAHDWAGMKRAQTPQTPRTSGHGASLSDEQVARLAPHLGDQGARAAAAARLHTDSTAADFAAEHQAHAVTVGSDIYFGRGEFAPGTEAGDELLVHELTHVAQGQRGELAHAAAKGLTSGTSLDPSEAEAELRGKLAAIELHAPAAKPAAVAPPAGGQPTTDGERAARIAEQKKRLADAETDTIPDEEVKPPESVAPSGPVAHPGPEMTAPKTSGDKKNAYVDALDAPPSKQAMTLWAQTAGKATTEANADQAAFDAALPPMPIELTGDEAKPTKGGAQAHQPKGKEQAPGSLPPSAQPTPTPAPPPVTAASASVENIVANPDKAAMEAEGKKAIAALPTTSPDVKTDPGTPPVTDLAGQGDPIRVNADQEQAYADGAKGLEAEKKKILAGPGAAQIQPKILNEKLEVPKASPPGQMPELPKVEGMDKFKKWNLPGGVQSSFDDVAKPKMEANLAQAKAKMSEAEVKRDQDRDKAVSEAQTKVKAAHADADAKQQAKVAESRTKITNKQAETLGKQEAEVKKLDKQSGEKKKATLSKVNDRIAKDQAKVETDYQDAQKKADAEKQKGEQEAKKKKEEAEKKANEEKSWWDKVADAICDAIQAIADEIDKALEAVGKLIGDILDAVKNAACQLIDAARDFVCAALSEFGDWLKSAVTALLGSVFPELAAALNKFIDDAVNAAKDAVNAIADGLKSAVTALCDGLKAAVNAAIAAYRAAVQAAATLAKALVTGDWAMVAKMVLEGILKLLGIDPEAFYALVGKAEDSIAKIIDDPGAFVGHLVDAVKLGFKQFGANFLTHLKDGVVQWLFGTFAEAGINIPAKFDVAGVFDLTCQVLGLTWPRLRVKVVKVIGEKNTERLEFVAGYIEALVTGGFAGLWEKVQQDMAGLWETVIGGAKQWLMEKLVQQAIIKIATMWNPAGAIIQLIQTAWNVYCWVKENAQRIFGLVQAVVDSISNIANGNIAGAANYIESSLAKLIPIAISLFANLLGLGGIADKIKSIIEKIQTKVDQAIDKLIDRVAKLFKGKDKGKGDDKDGDGKADGDKDKADENKPVGARITFTAHGETHTQYIDKGVPMVASTPTGVKAKIEEWRPRLRELTDEQQKRAGKLIGKAIGIEKKVAELAGQAKSDKTKEASLEAKQRELADTLAQLWELMAPDMDPNKPFAEQDPMATLKTDQYRQFKSRFTKLAADLDMPGGDAKAQELWLQVVTTLQKTDAAYKAAPTAGTSGRKDLAADGFKKIMAEFEPITAAIKPYMDNYAKGKKSWAFWSGKPSVELAKKHGEVCLEKSALGGLFDNINISGSWDIQMWASLSKAYATHAASHVGNANYSGFVGLGSSADQSIFNKIEQPQFVGMLNEKQKVDLKIDWYAGACNVENPSQPDYDFKAGSIDGVYAKGDRAAMVDKAETENKRRIDLFKEKGIKEGPNGTEGDKKDEKKPVGARVAFTAHGETHTQFIDENGTPTVASTPTAVKAKIEEWRPRLQQLTDEQQKRAGQLISKAVSTEKKVAELAGQVKSGKAQDTVLEGKQRELANTMAQLWELMAPDVDPNKPFAEQDPKSTLKSDQYKQFKSRFTKLATDLDMAGGDAKAQEIWMKVVEALQKTDAAYKAAPSDAKSGRKDLAADGFKKIMEDFDPITNALKPYMEKYAHGKKSWAFWSGKPSVELAKKHAEVCLEKSALGGLFDNINISGGWDIQMWASLSKAYATHAAQHVGEAKYSGFVGMGSSAEQSIFNKIEQPQFVGMLSDKQKVDLKIDWYAGACNPENPGQPDYRFKAGSIDGVYAKGDRAAMVDKAETENKRRVDLFKEKGINEGPEGGANDKEVMVPKALTEATKLHLASTIDNKLKTEAANTPSGTVLYQNADADPKAATQTLLAKHPNAKLDKSTGVLALPPVQADSTPSSLRELASQIANSTGVSRITFVIDAKGWRLDGSINPTVEGLASYATTGGRLDPLIQSLQAELGKQQPNRDLLIAICRERADKFGATFQQNYIKPGRGNPTARTEVTFTEKNPPGGATAEVYNVDIVVVSKDAACPSCGAMIGTGGKQGSKPHNVIPASMWKGVLERVFSSYGVTLADGSDYSSEVLAAGAKTGGPAVTQDLQCRDCEKLQDTPANGLPHSLVQRGHAPAGPGKDAYVGEQFKHTSMDQMVELTKVKIDNVTDRIRYMLGLAPTGTAGARPATHSIYVNIVNPGLVNDLIAKISAAALAEATSTAPATSYPT